MDGFDRVREMAAYIYDDIIFAKVMDIGKTQKMEDQLLQFEINKDALLKMQEEGNIPIFPTRNQHGSSVGSTEPGSPFYPLPPVTNKNKHRYNRRHPLNTTF